MRFFRPRRIIKIFILLVLLVFVYIGIANIVMLGSAKRYIYQDSSAVPSAPVALVLGAGVSSKGILSPVFKERVDTALSLYRKGKVANILVSGDNSTEEYNEVSPVRLYLIEQGVPESDIYLDHAGFDTYDSIYRAREIFEVDKMVVITQHFHLYRAVFLARFLNIEAYGYPTPEDYLTLRNMLRESIARAKSLAEAVLGVKPSFLGDPIPIL